MSHFADSRRPAEGPLPESIDAASEVVLRLHAEVLGKIAVHHKVRQMLPECDVLIHLDRFRALKSDEGLPRKLKSHTWCDDPVLNLAGVIPILNQFHGWAPGLH